MLGIVSFVYLIVLGWLSVCCSILVILDNYLNIMFLCMYSAGGGCGVLLVLLLVSVQLVAALVCVCGDHIASKLVWSLVLLPMLLPVLSLV